MKPNILYLLLISLFLLISACEKPEKKNQFVEEELANTLETTDLGGKTGHILSLIHI